MASELRLSMRRIVHAALVLACACCVSCSAVRNPSFPARSLSAPKRIAQQANDEIRYQLSGVVTLTDGEWGFTYRPLADGPARGSFLDSHHTASGWGILRVEASPDRRWSDAQRMFGAGYLEGWLSAERIYDHFHNMRGFFNMSTSKPVDWLVQQDRWARQQAAANSSGIWAAIGPVLQQFDGLLAGYNARVGSAAAEVEAMRATAAAVAAAEADGSGGGLWQLLRQAARASGWWRLSGGDGSGESGRELRERLAAAETRQPLPLSRADLLMVSAVGDLGDLIPALDRTKRPVWHAMAAGELASTLATRGKCSALVKVTGDLSDLLLSHSSWYTYAAMQRVYKYYDLPLDDPAIKLRRASYSSYAGELSSDDDFYLLDTGLAVLQTTNDILDTSLYDLLTPASLTSWQRVRAANMLATTGGEWGAAVDAHQSGTCNNQYMVVDLKRFRPQQELQKGLLTVVEQVPGLTVSADQTAVLERGYWPSYNVPYYAEIYDRSGYKRFREVHAARGPDYARAVEGLSYQLAPRAALFRRDESDATDVDSLRRLMRSNDWDADSYSRNSSLGAICGRGDIDGARPVAYGCYDTKAASLAMAAQRRAVAVVGPTVEGGRKPFRWDEQNGRFDGVPHRGQPPVFDFRFQLMAPLA